MILPNQGTKTKHTVLSMQQFTSLLSLRWGHRPYFQRKTRAEEAEWDVLSVRLRVLLSLYTLTGTPIVWGSARICKLNFGFSVFAVSFVILGFTDT